MISAKTNEKILVEKFRFALRVADDALKKDVAVRNKRAYLVVRDIVKVFVTGTYFDKARMVYHHLYNAIFHFR
mgnify:CR=1 FL=1